MTKMKLTPAIADAVYALACRLADRYIEQLELASPDATEFPTLEAMADTSRYELEARFRSHVRMLGAHRAQYRHEAVVKAAHSLIHTCLQGNASSWFSGRRDLGEKLILIRSAQESAPMSAN